MIDPHLERYLTSLDQALKAFPVSDRAEIITEIRSHVLSALERDPETGVDTVLSSLGEAETVANRYLLERGMKPAKTPISPVVKWLVIGFLGTLAMFLIFSAYLIGHFGSILQVDGKNGRVKVLGGLIDIDGGHRLSISSPTNQKKDEFAGSETMPATATATVHFANGKMRIETTDDDRFSWSCHSKSALRPVAKHVAAETSDKGNDLNLDLTAITDPDCVIRLPVNTKFAISAVNGLIEIEEPKFSVDANLVNGQYHFEEDSDTEYRFDVAVTTGTADAFVSSEAPTAKNIKLKLVTGVITNENPNLKQ